MNIQFPERKGALRDLLRAISPITNVCYFNYAYSGEVIGRALMGFEFNGEQDKIEFMDILENSVVKFSPLDETTAQRILKH